MLAHLEVKATLSTKKRLKVLGFKMNIRELNRYIYKHKFHDYFTAPQKNCKSLRAKPFNAIVRALK